MNAALRKYSQPTLWDIDSATSSQESGDGAWPCSSQDGQPTGESGQEAVPASPTVLQESRREMLTNEICGLPGTSSCESSTPDTPSRSLTRSLVSRLIKRLGTVGSMEYVDTWKQKATPADMPYWEHTASARKDGLRSLTSTQEMSHGEDGSKPAHPISDSGCTGWPSPTAQEGSRGGLPPRPHDTGVPLSQMVAGTAGWVTPSSRDWKDTAGMSETGTNPDGSLRVRLGQNRGATVSTQAQLTTGVTSTLSPAETEKRGVLNPEFVAWLMGYPGEWLSCVDWATLSSRKSQRNS